jgi:hypothetical protein
MVVCSDYGAISRAVPHWSIIAPLVLSLYYSGVVSCFSERDILLYADDTAIVSSSSDIISGGSAQQCVAVRRKAIMLFV